MEIIWLRRTAEADCKPVHHSAETHQPMGKKFESGPGNPGRATAFKKGQSGNPGGRPKTIEAVREHARSYTVEAIEALVSNLTDESGAVRNAAAQAILAHKSHKRRCIGALPGS